LLPNTLFHLIDFRQWIRLAAPDGILDASNTGVQLSEAMAMHGGERRRRQNVTEMGDRPGLYRNVLHRIVELPNRSAGSATTQLRMFSL
jgi:hypothetical protein